MISLNLSLPKVASLKKSDIFSKNTNGGKLKKKQRHSKVLLNSFPMNGHTLSIESKVRKLRITKGFTLGIKGSRKDVAAVQLGVTDNNLVHEKHLIQKQLPNQKFLGTK